MLLLHLHAPVHGSPTFLWFASCFTSTSQLTSFISSQLSGMGARDISLGTRLPSNFVQPMFSGRKKVGWVKCACFHVITWKCILLMCNHATSLIGERASGDWHLENKVVYATLQLSTSGTLNILKKNFLAEFTVESSRSLFPRFLSSTWFSCTCSTCERLP